MNPGEKASKAKWLTARQTESREGSWDKMHLSRVFSNDPRPVIHNNTIILGIQQGIKLLIINELPGFSHLPNILTSYSNHSSQKDAFQVRQRYGQRKNMKRLHDPQSLTQEGERLLLLFLRQ